MTRGSSNGKAGILVTRDPLFKRIKKQYANIFLSTEVTSMNAQEEGIQVGFKGKGAPEFDSFDKVLVSIGRTRLPKGIYRLRILHLRF
jgi:pyruvate/2-oxoglutarate dehydrogenase complex dihydrolipoamide dehydrogenase (E3) component